MYVTYEKTVKLFKRAENRLSRKDVQIGFNATGSELSFHLQCQPYYEVEQRNIIEYTPVDSPLDVVLGVVEVVAWLRTILTKKDIGSWRKWRRNVWRFVSEHGKHRGW